MSITSLPRRGASLRVASIALLALASSACSLSGTSDEASDEGAAGGNESKKVVLATHESWAVPKEVLAEFTRETGYTVEVQAAGDAGALTNKLVLTKGSPIARRGLRRRQHVRLARGRRGSVRRPRAVGRSGLGRGVRAAR